jgi:type I restriction enzyme R subunit
VSAIHSEHKFETELCAHLAANGWLHSENDAGYDAELALHSEDAIAWLKSTQPKEWSKLQTRLGADAEKQTLSLLRKQLNTHGTISVLRHGYKDVNAQLRWCQFKPAHTHNADILANYQQVRLRVMQQVHYSTSNKNCIDLVLFCNGIPVATLELKTELTQNVRNAIEQYCNDRKPRDPVSNRIEPLLQSVSGALVHWATSTDEVWMTTQLAGSDTRFIPFNLGADMGAGNPVNPAGYRTAYLWEQILERDAWLDILARFVHVQGKAQNQRVLFPRMHQWQAVTTLVQTATTEGAGRRYLIQHSAGSGKTNSISWLAHQLASAHDAQDEKLFDSVIVVTDRTVLDSQLQDAIKQIDHQHGVVKSINNDAGSKSEQLAHALRDRTPIIIVTMQTFPHVMKLLGSDGALSKRRFAVIADEAHSSQTGMSAKTLKQVLSAERVQEVEDGGELDLEELLEAEIASNAAPLNVSWFAFTATPKAKTLELFGRTDSTGKPQAFHVYSMQQAIEEGFILDVLRNYTSYHTAYKLAAEHAESEVDKRRAKTALVRWVKLHEHNLSQHVAVIVEHFRQHVQWRMNGNAKGMVVTDSRLAAVRYKQALDRYIKQQGYADVDALVAFSGEVVDPDTEQSFTETSTTLNPTLNKRDHREAFSTPEFQILIVANKFQTGFDQPLLCAMYVDKRLDGVSAVQTLSRLNRTAPGKTETFVLDFVNEPAVILAAFQVYYRRAQLQQVTDPNIVHELHAKLNASGIYLISEVDAVVLEALKGKKASQAKVQAALAPAVSRWRDGLKYAQQQRDEQRVAELRLFKSDVASLLRLYSFLSQIVNYADTDLEKHTIYLRLLLPLLDENAASVDIDLSTVLLTHYNLRKVAEGDLGLHKGTEQQPWVPGAVAAGSGAAQTPEQIKLREIIVKLNQLFEGDLTDNDLLNYARTVTDKLVENPVLVQQHGANTAAQFAASTDFHKAVEDAVVKAYDTHSQMAGQVLSSEAVMTGFRSVVLQLMTDALNSKVKAAAT